jgi:hypothetical protein
MLHATQRGLSVPRAEHRQQQQTGERGWGFRWGRERCNWLRLAGEQSIGHTATDSQQRLTADSSKCPLLSWLAPCSCPCRHSCCVWSDSVEC